MDHSFFRTIIMGDDGFADLPDQTICGKVVSCQVMQGQTPVSHEQLDQFAAFCQSADIHAEDAFEYIKDNHEEVVGFAYEGWFEDEPDLMKQLFPNAADPSEVSGDNTVARIAPARIELSTGDEAPHITIDFVFTDLEDLNYLLAAEYDIDGQLEHVSLES